MPFWVGTPGSGSLAIDGPRPWADVRAHGAVGDGAADDGPAWNNARAALPSSGGIVFVPQGSYLLTTAFSFGALSNVLLWILPGVALSGAALPTPTGSNALLDWRSGNNVIWSLGAGGSLFRVSAATGTMELDLGALANAANLKWWRFLVNEAGGMEIQTGSDAGPFATAATIIALSNGAVLATWDASGINLDADVAAFLFRTALGVVRAYIQSFTIGANGGDLRFMTKPDGGAIAERWRIDSSGILFPALDNSLDIGVTGTNRPRNLLASGFYESVEIADPSAPAANSGRLYFRDSGTGKTQLVVRFPTGAVQVIATEP